MRLKRQLVWTFVFVAYGYMALPSHVLAFSSTNVPIADRAYHDIDILVSFGLINNIVYGQRPWSRNEIARIVEESMKGRDELCNNASDGDKRVDCHYVDEVLERFKVEYREELIDRGALPGQKKSVRFDPFDEIQFEYLLLDSPGRDVPRNIGLGNLDAEINPLIAYRSGRHYVDGNNLSIELLGRARLSQYFALYVRPRFELLVPNTGSSEVNPIVQQLYGKLTFKNVEIEIGRDELIWGQGAFGGLFLSNNARPFDLIKLSNPSPARLPWVFKHLGYWRYTFFVANLGPEREFPYSWLTGAKLNLRPLRFFELGIEQILVLGGEGGPGPLTVGNVISEFFGVRPGNINEVNLSNRAIGFDGRFLLPFLRNSQLYLELHFEDSESSPAFLFTNLASYQAGLYVPRLDLAGKKGLRLEYVHGSPFTYKHGSFDTGMALNRRLWGQELGPQGDGLYVTWTNMLSPDLLMSMSFHYERRDSDRLRQLQDPDNTNRRLEVVEASPEEHRIRLMAAASWSIKPWLRLEPELGYEYVENFNFVSGTSQNNIMAGFRLSLLDLI